MSEGADVDSLRQVTQGFIDSGKGVDPGFENLDEKVIQSVLFPELLPKFAGPNHGDSFEYFHRNGQVGDFVWTNYPRLQFIINHMRDRIEQKGIVFKVMRNSEPIHWIVISCASIITIIFGLWSSGWTFSTLINNPIQTIVSIVFFAGLFVWAYYYWVVVIKWAGKWEQEEDLVNKLPRSGHQRWNEEIFILWENKLEDRIKEIIENRTEVTDQDIKDAKEIFINAVIKCDTGGHGLKVRGRRPSVSFEDLLPSLPRLRMILIWQSESLTKDYCKFLQDLDVDQVDSLHEQDIEEVISPTLENSQKLARNDIQKGINRLPGLNDCNLDVLFEQPQFWLEKKIFTYLEGKKTETSFFESVMNYLDEWSKSDKKEAKPFTLSDRAASGKTTILNLLCLASKARPSGFWALRIKLKEFSKTRTPSEGSLISQIEEELLAKSPDGFANDKWAQSVRFFFRKNHPESQKYPVPLIILDGLDEVDNENRDQWRKSIFQEHRIPIIVSTRPSTSKEESQRYSFSEVTTSQRMRLLELAGVDDIEVESLLEQTLDRLPPSSNNPFMCLMIIGLLLQNNSDHTRVDLDISLDSLSRKFIEGIVEREWGHKKTPVAMDPVGFALQAPKEIGKKLLQLDCDDSIIVKSEDYALLGKDLAIRDSWLEGHYISRAIKDMSNDKTPAPDVFLKPGEDLDDRNELILRQMISSNPSDLFQWDEFGERASFAFSVIAEEWVARSSEGRKKYLQSFGLGWGVGDTKPLGGETIRRISDRSLETVSGLLHLHCSMFAVSQESLGEWRKTKSDKAWEGLLGLVLEKIEPRISNKINSEIAKNFDRLFAWEERDSFGRRSKSMPPIVFGGVIERFNSDEGWGFIQTNENLEIFVGVVKWFDSVKGFGSIEVEEGKLLLRNTGQQDRQRQELRFHESTAYSGVKEGDKVTFNRGWKKSGPIGINVTETTESFQNFEYSKKGSVGWTEEEYEVVTWFHENHAYSGVKEGDKVTFNKGWNRNKSGGPIGINVIEPTKGFQKFVEKYLDSPHISKQKSAPKSVLFKRDLEKIYRHINYFRCQTNSGPPTGGDFLTWALSESEWPDPQSGFEVGRREVDSLAHSSMWIPIDKNAPKSKKQQQNLTGESSSLPILSLVSSIIESRKSISSLAILLSTIEAIASEKVLRISIDDAIRMKEELIDYNQKSDHIAQTLILRLLSITTHENRGIILENYDALDNLGMNSDSNRVVEIRIGRGKEEVLFFNKQGDETLVESNYKINELRFFDEEYNEVREVDLPDEIEGSAVVIADGTDFHRLSPVLLRTDKSGELRESALDLLPTNIEENGFSAIGNFHWEWREGRAVAKALLNRPDSRNFITTLQIGTMSVIRPPRVGITATTCWTGTCDTSSLELNPCLCSRKSNLFLYEARRMSSHGFGSDRYGSTMATLLSNPAKSLIIQPPKPNRVLSEIAVSFENDHSIMNHRNVKKRLIELRDKCHVYLQYGWTRAWYEKVHLLVIPGLESRGLVFPESIEDPLSRSISSGFSKFFETDAPSCQPTEPLDIEKNLSEPLDKAKGRWYLCNFEVKRTMNGYELIMPAPDSIELLCQKCLGVTISEPIQDGMEPLFICQSCHSSEEE